MDEVIPSSLASPDILSPRTVMTVMDVGKPSTLSVSLENHYPIFQEADAQTSCVTEPANRGHWVMGQLMSMMIKHDSANLCSEAEAHLASPPPVAPSDRNAGGATGSTPRPPTPLGPSVSQCLHSPTVTPAPCERVVQGCRCSVMLFW